MPVYSIGQTPTALGSTYTLGEKDGFNGFNYTVIYHAASGKVYTKTYNGDVAIHGNNYVFELPKISRISTLPGGKFYEVNKNLAYYFDSKKVVIIKSDTVYKIINYPSETSNYYENMASIIVCINNANSLDTYILENESLVLKSKSILNYLNDNAVLLKSRIDNNMYFINYLKDSLQIFKTFNKNLEFKLVKSYLIDSINILDLNDENNFVAEYTYNSHQLIYGINGNIVKKNTTKNYYDFYYSINQFTKNIGAIQTEKNIYQLKDLNNLDKLPLFMSKDFNTLLFTEKNYGSFYIKTGNSPLRIFNHIQKYPSVFSKDNSIGIFALQQNDKGTIFTGSYIGGLSKIENDSITFFNKTIQYKFSNGGCSFGNNLYFNTEITPNCILQVNNNGSINKIPKAEYGFYHYITKDRKYFYSGLSQYKGMWRLPTSDLDKKNIEWKKIDSSKGVTLLNILTITEDKLGRIWCAHPKRGIAVYNPKTDKAQTWQISKNETTFGAMSSITDNKGTVWLGSEGKGLWYYNNYNKEASPQNCERIYHPLLNNAKVISALTIYKDWLVINAFDKTLILNLDTFYKKNKIILRYLNPIEANYTSFTEQNTMLTSNIDSSIWFSTSDMLYKWDIKNWLTMPIYKVALTTQISNGNKESKLINKSIFDLEAGNNSFDISLQYLSPDNMPRYLTAVLIRDGDTLIFPNPSTTSNFSYKNLNVGLYHYHIQIFESDGNTTNYEYQIKINKHIWQQWWFWLLATLLFLIPIMLWLNAKRNNAVKQKQLSQMQVVTLSNQFRPHFILNALNTIGAQMDDKPEAEMVLSRLGESINIIFGHAQQQKISHAFADEWSLVKNIIELHKLMYLKQLETDLPSAKILASINNIMLPLGLLQIPVENALLHGLSNKENGPWLLTINIKENDINVVITIKDNGVGRKNAATLSNFTKHGTGTKNIANILQIVNANNTNKITIVYEDDIYKNESLTYGTAAIITIPKDFNYEAK